MGLMAHFLAVWFLSKYLVLASPFSDVRSDQEVLLAFPPNKLGL